MVYQKKQKYILSVLRCSCQREATNASRQVFIEKEENKMTKSTNKTNLVTKLAAMVVAIAMVFIFATAIPAQVDAASPVYPVKTSIKPIGGGKGCKVWVQDTISYKVQNGKIVTKPQVSSKTSVANKLLGGTGLTEYYKVKAPTVSYRYGNKTATVKTYWGVKQGVSIWKMKITWGKTCTVTYTVNANGRITYSKVASGIKLFP